MLDVDAIRRRALLEVPEGARVFLGAGLAAAIPIESRGASAVSDAPFDLAILDASMAPPTLSFLRVVVVSGQPVLQPDLVCDRWIGPLGVVDFVEGVPCVVEVPAGVSAADVQRASAQKLYACASLSPIRSA